MQENLQNIFFSGKTFVKCKQKGGNIMGKAKEPYWSYVKAIIKEYPALKKQLAKPLEQRVTAYLGAGGRGSRIANPTQDCVIHNLPPKQQRCCDRGNRKNQKASSGKCQGASPGYRFSILETVPHHRRRCSAGAVSQECSGALAGGLY